MSRARVRIRSHRITDQGRSDLRGTPRVREAMELFSGELRTAVGEAVFERIRSGRWHRSRDPDYGRYRTWSKYRYGSSRARTRVGARAKGSRANDQPHAAPVAPKGLDIRDTVERLKFEFLAKNLRKQAQRQGTGYVVSNRSRAGSGFAQATQAYDVTSALDKLDQIFRKVDEINAQEDNPEVRRQKVQDHMTQAVNSFLNGAYDYNRFFKETRLGQKFLRSAEIAAQRFSRNGELLGAESEYDHATRRYNTTDRQSQGASYSKIRGALLQGKGRSFTAVSGSGFAWGYQTGTLANAWKAAKDELTRSPHGFTFTIAASDKKDGRNPSPLMLTQYLKRNIRKQGGTPALLDAASARRASRNALKAVTAKWAELGVRPRGGAGGGS